MPNYMLIPDCVVGELNALWNATSISVLVLRVAPFLQEVDHFYAPDLLINHCQWEGLKMTWFFLQEKKALNSISLKYQNRLKISLFYRVFCLYYEVQ